MLGDSSPFEASHDVEHGQIVVMNGVFAQRDIPRPFGPAPHGIARTAKPSNVTRHRPPTIYAEAEKSWLAGKPAGNSNWVPAFFPTICACKLNATALTPVSKYRFGTFGIYTRMLRNGSAARLACTSEPRSIDITTDLRSGKPSARMATWTCDFCAKLLFSIQHHAVHALSIYSRVLWKWLARRGHASDPCESLTQRQPSRYRGNPQASCATRRTAECPRRMASAKACWI